MLYESLILFLEDNVKAYKQKEKKGGGVIFRNLDFSFKKSA
ncbi:hypothetical protein CCO1432 [Campylobacter coli RM2228]|nr:hypothetical protein CCO1432 [Campylobacter coli RM2228]